MDFTIVSAKSCSACTALKKAFEEKGIVYEELDIEKDYKKLTELTVPVTGLPTTIITHNGHVIDVYSGFSGIKLTEWEMLYENESEEYYEM